MCIYIKAYIMWYAYSYNLMLNIYLWLQFGKHESKINVYRSMCGPHILTIEYALYAFRFCTWLHLTVEIHFCLLHKITVTWTCGHFLWNINYYIYCHFSPFHRLTPDNNGSYVPLNNNISIFFLIFYVTVKTWDMC